MDTLQIPESLLPLERLLDSSPDRDELMSALQELSSDQRKDLLDLTRAANARASTTDFIEYIWSEHLEENNDGFLPQHLIDAITFIEEELIAKNQSGVTLMPRGGSKTTGITLGKVSKLIADNPNIRIGLFSNTDRQAWAFSGAIRSMMESNDRFVDLYGDCVSKRKWTDAEWLHKDSRHARGKDRTMYAGGVGTPVLSKRFDIIVLDDILDKENTANAEQMQKTLDWFNLVLLPCLVPKTGIVIYIGTRWAEEDLAEHLITDTEKGGKGWPHFIIPAWSQDEATRELVSYWPDRWPISELLKWEGDMGSADFAVAFLNDLSGRLKGNIFPKLTDSYYFTSLPEGEYIFKMGIDLASSERESADFTARVVSAIDQDGNYWVLHAYRDKREDRHAEFVADGFAAYSQVALVIVENNQFQSTLIQNVMRDYPFIPIEGRKSDVDKVTRARAVAAKYESHKVRHHVSLRGSAFERELSGFPKGHDDFVDALGFSMDLSGGGFFFGSLGIRSRTLRR